MQEIAVNLGPVHVAVIDRAIKHILDGIDAAVADHEQDRCNKDACCDTLQKSNRGNDAQDHPDQQVIEQRQGLIGVDQPFHQEG